MLDAGDRMRRHLLDIEQRNEAVLDAVSDQVYATIAADGLVFTTGTGHSLAMVLETYYRAGGLACVRPVVHPALLPLEGGLASTQLERVPGLGRVLVEAATPSPTDTAFVFSNSGTNQVPVEMAQVFKEAGTPVVAVSSVEHMSRAPARASQKLDELADYLLDTGAPYGDAFIETATESTAALSSLAGVYLWNLLLARLAARAHTAGTALPIWASANVAGGDERNRQLFARYRSRIPML
jgi:uncharacterized phosphosugar-binding protein